QGISTWRLRGHLAAAGAGRTHDAVARCTAAWPPRSASPTRLMRACRPDAAPVRAGAEAPAAYEHRGRDGAHAILDPLSRLPLIGPAVRPVMARPGELTATAAPPGPAPPALR